MTRTAGKADDITGARLARWREAHGWDRRELADRMRKAAPDNHVAERRGLQRMIRSWEVGEHTPADRYQLLYRQLGYPGVTVDASDVRWLAGYGRRNRRLIWITIASLALDLALTAVLVIFGVQLHHTAASAANLCQSGNVSRAEQIRLWDYVISISKPPASAAERAKVAAFQHHLQVIFAPRNCDRLNPRTP